MDPLFVTEGFMIDFSRDLNEDTLGEEMDALFENAKEIFDVVKDQFDDEERSAIASFFDNEEYVFYICEAHDELWIDSVRDYEEFKSHNQMYEIRFSSPDNKQIDYLAALNTPDGEFYLNWMVPPATSDL